MKKSLFGYGLTTKAIAKQGGWDIYDNQFSEIAKDEFGNSLLPVGEFDENKSELEIPSPGFPRTHELVKKAKNLISEYDYFDDFKGVKIWISGTNGKTTTTQMTQFLLENKGSCMGGNVGVPLANLDKSAKIWVLETSSFTIHYTKFSKPDIYVLLPITPDHLSWHGDFSEYVKAKLKPLALMSEGGVAIVPKAYANTPSLAKVIGYTDENDLARYFGINLSEIKFRVPFLMDAIMALSVEKILFDRANAELLNNFVIEGNKLEEFSDKFGRIWVNDTKATNLDAAIQALRRYKDKKIHIILGGDDKGVDLTPVFEELANLRVLVYAIGSNTDKIINLCEKFKIMQSLKTFSQKSINNKLEELAEILFFSHDCTLNGCGFTATFDIHGILYIR